jgi:glycine dehydrogenase subunit 1
MHMALLGPEGLHALAVRNMTACILAKQKLSQVENINLPHSNSHHFNEFVIELPGSSKDCLAHLDAVGIVGGFDLSAWYPERKNWILATFTDQNNANQIELLVSHLALWASSQGVNA